MTRFATPVSAYMSAPVHSVPERTSLREVQNTLHDRGISCVPIVDGEGRCVGVISRSDLLRLGRIEARARGRRSLLDLPERAVSHVMQRDVVVVGPDAHVSVAAQLMVKHRIHRVFALQGGRPAGVFSTKEILAAICAERVAEPIVERMAEPPYTIPVESTIAAAVDRLQAAHASGLVVVDAEGWPVGLFTQTEALQARDLPAGTPLDEVMSYAMLCLDAGTPLHRAAAHAYETRARRVLVVEERQLKGVLTGLDFARVAARG